MIVRYSIDYSLVRLMNSFTICIENYSCNIQKLKMYLTSQNKNLVYIQQIKKTIQTSVNIIN